MILKLPPPCLDNIITFLEINDQLCLSQTCRILYEVIKSRIYKCIYYCPSYEYRNEYMIIRHEEQLTKFIRTVKSGFYKYEFINLSDVEILEVDGVIYKLNELGETRDDELFIEFDKDEFDKDYLVKFDEKINVKTLSIVVRNGYTMEEFDKIINSINVEQIIELELNIIDDAKELIIFKTLLIFIENFKTLDKLSISWYCSRDDGKNNLRILLINSILLNLNLNSIMIYLDLSNLTITQLVILYYQLDKFEGVIEFNMNLENFEIDFILLDEFIDKNLISNSSIIILLLEEFININKKFDKIFHHVNSNLLRSRFQYILNYQNEFLYCDYFLKDKLNKIKLFNVIFKKNKIINIDNFNNKLSVQFTNDLNDINQIFS